MALACNLHVAGGGNLFMRDLAQLYAAALGDLGFDAQVKVDGIPTGEAGVVELIVAPHEYFVVGPQLTDRERRAVARRCAMLTTEQPGSHWWEVQRPWVEMAPFVMDISPVGTEELNRSGIAARRAPLGYHSSLDAWGGADASERDVDVCFMGGSTPRRRALVGRVAPVLAHRSSRLLFHDPRIPVTEPSRYFLAGRDKAELLARSRILLNVHRDEIAYFEWVRAIEAIANGAVLLTEPSLGAEPLEPMVHMVSSDGPMLAAHVTALLADEGLRAKIARNAYDFVRSEMQLADLLLAGVLEPLCETAAGGATAPTDPTDPTDRDASVLSEASARVAAGQVGEGSGTPGVPGLEGFELTLPEVPPPPAPLEVPETAEYRTMAGLRRALLGQIALQRRLQRMELERAGIDPEAVERIATPAFERAQPEVSVIVPLYNYEATVLDAIGSVLTSRNVELEVIVVEDASTDGSRAAIEGFIEDNPEAPVAAVLRAANRGLSKARNLAIAEARSDRCFLLDADNAVYPDALWKLRDELDATGAAVAYCILEVFEGPPDLVSALPWNTRTLALGPYIDAMSLIDRKAWEAVGGFREDDSAIYGLEDYAFWLALADEGFEGAWVPEPLVRYRRHPGSMTGVTALDLVTPLNIFRHTYRRLPW